MDLDSLALATSVLLRLMPQNYFPREVKISKITSQACIHCGLFLTSLKNSVKNIFLLRYER